MSNYLPKVLVSEGILTSLKELYALEVHQNELGITVEMTISSSIAALKEHRRMMVGRTGCGLCGIESLEQFQLDVPKLQRMHQKYGLSKFRLPFLI